MEANDKSLRQAPRNWLSDLDLHLHGEGTFEKAYEKLGAHLITIDGTSGTIFAVWAPNAKSIAVIGDFNKWNPGSHPMFSSDSGIWTLFVPDIKEHTVYKYQILTQDNKRIDKADPYAFAMEERPRTGSVTVDLDTYDWHDETWMQARPDSQHLDRPISIYEVQLGSWRKQADNKWGKRFLTYNELSNELIPYVVEMGFTHIEIMPIAEFPYDGSWGYQVLSFFSPTSRFGTPNDFMHFVDSCHQSGIGVILDWVPAHFPKDESGLNCFDGTHLYSHEDPKQGDHQDWGTKVFNYGRNEVRTFLISNALFWLEKYHIDGLRVDAVASMLYLDYSRESDQWVPNKYGGRENLDAVTFLKKTNEILHGRFPGILTIAEESTSWPMVSRPTYLGGLGFSLKWNMGWMHDTLQYISTDPLFRKYHHSKMTFGMLYAFHENFTLPLSHDEVVHGKGSLLGKMPGDDWQKFAGLRAYYGFMWCYPGKKLLFMGSEFGQSKEWDHDDELQWELLSKPYHSGLKRFTRDLNLVYKIEPALYEQDFDWSGFRWIDANDSDNSVLSFVRFAKNTDDFLIIICNFTPVVRKNYKIGVPKEGTYYELVNSDQKVYHGSDISNPSKLKTNQESFHAMDNSLSLTLPPLSTLILKAY